MRASEIKRMAILTVTPELLCQLLQLPDGVELLRVEMAQGQRGVLHLMIEGAGWETPEGAFVQPAPVATCFANDRVLVDKVDWNLPI